MQINRPGTLTWWRLDPMGMPQTLDPNVEYASTCVEPALGKLVRHFTYDGVGRLARTSTPLEAPEGWTFQDGSGNAVTAFTRSERFIYDGVRRVQEIVTDPVMTDEEGNRVATMSAESDQRGGSHGGGSGSGEAGELPEVNLFLRAQYVWGPGDNGVDELLCQIEPYSQAENHTGSGGPQGKPWFILTDAQGDVVSIASVGMGLGGGSPIASVAGQWTYSPYGEVLTYDGLSEHPAVVFGHKTLAIDRLDAPALTWENESAPGAADGALFETRRLEPGARLLAYARNRTLDIQRGRWLQTDPNASGTQICSANRYQGTSATFRSPSVNLDTRNMDGIALYGYARSNSIRLSDPLGTSAGLLPGIGLYADLQSSEMKTKGAISLGIMSWIRAMAPVAYIGGGALIYGGTMSAAMYYGVGGTADAGAAPETMMYMNSLPANERAFDTELGVFSVSPTINPVDVAGKTPAEIDRLARASGLIPKGPDPQNGKGAYVDPITGKQRVLSHPDAKPRHAHVNNPAGERLDIHGNPVPPESPEAHLPIK